MQSLIYHGLRHARGAGHLVVPEAPADAKPTKKPAAKRKPRATKKAMAKVEVPQRTSTSTQAPPITSLDTNQTFAGYGVYSDDGGQGDVPFFDVPFEALSLTPPLGKNEQRVSVDVAQDPPRADVRALATESRVNVLSDDDVGLMRLFDMEEANETVS